MRKAHKYFLLSATLLAVLVNVFAWRSTVFCDFYVENIFPLWLTTYGKWTSAFPFSIGEVMIVLAVALLGMLVMSGVGAVIFLLIRKWKEKSRFLSDSFVKKYNAYQTHKQLTLSRNDFESFINSFKFSEEDTMNKDYAIALLDRLNAENVDMWYMRYGTGEHRSTSDYRVNALLQGRSEGKVETDPDYYVGDRYIKTDNLSVQIHRVFLKNDIEDQYTKGDEVYMLAFILPDNYVGGSAARRMTTAEIRNRL